MRKTLSKRFKGSLEDGLKELSRWHNELTQICDDNFDFVIAKIDRQKTRFDRLLDMTSIISKRLRTLENKVSEINSGSDNAKSRTTEAHSVQDELIETMIQEMTTKLYIEPEEKSFGSGWNHGVSFCIGVLLDRKYNKGNEDSAGR